MISYEVLDIMMIYGGGFVKQLVILYKMADDENKQKLEETFKVLFDKHKDKRWRKW